MISESSYYKKKIKRCHFDIQKNINALNKFNELLYGQNCPKSVAHFKGDKMYVFEEIVK